MPAPLDSTTLVQARTDVRSYIDDVRARRWSNDQVNRKLRNAISTCVQLYAEEGGDRFDEEVSVPTVAGSVSLLAYDPLDIRAILIAQSATGPWSTAIEAADPKVRGTLDSTARNLLIRLVRRPALPVDDDDLLIGVTGGAMRSWPAFDAWVCMVAALELRTKDDDPRVPLVTTEREKRAEVLVTKRLPATLPWPVKRQRVAWDDLRWLFDQRTATLTLHSVQGVR